MRKFIAMLLALLLAASLPTLAEGALTGSGDTMIGEAPIGDTANPGNYQVVSCPELGFSTLTGHGLNCYFEEVGMFIDLGNDDDSPWLMIARADAPGSQFNVSGYFNNAFTPQMRDNYGSDLIDVGQLQTYTVAGVETKGVMYTYRVGGRDRVCFVLFALREDGFVRYEARYYADDSEDAMAALCVAVYYYQPDANYYTGGSPAPQSEPEPEPEPQTSAPDDGSGAPGTYQGKTILSCPELGFSTLTSTQVGTEYVEGEGLLIYTEVFDSVPFAQVFVLSKPVEDLHDYIDRGLTPYMQSEYGKDLLAVNELGDTTLAGHSVVGAVYTYRAGDYVLEVYRVYENRNGRTMMYVAKYILGEGDATMAALEEAVTYLQDDPDYYVGAAAAPIDIEGGSSDRLPGCDDTKPQNPDVGGDTAPQAAADIGNRKVLSCPELGFSTAVDPALIETYVEGDGLYVTSHGKTGIPSVLIYRSGDVLGEPGEYIREQWTPHMQEKYGDDLAAYVEYEYYEVGGKQLPAGKYTYRVENTLVDALRIIESTPQGTVIYTAKYVNGDDAETLAVLDDVVRFMQQDANYYN